MGASPGRALLARRPMTSTGFEILNSHPSDAVSLLAVALESERIHLRVFIDVIFTRIAKFLIKLAALLR